MQEQIRNGIGKRWFPGGKGRGTVRYFGIPAGYEFAVLLEAVLDAARGTTDLAPATKRQIAALPKPVHLEVLVTPT